jgi:hypothetical protein
LGSWGLEEVFGCSSPSLLGASPYELCGSAPEGDFGWESGVLSGMVGQIELILIEKRRCGRIEDVMR